MLTATVFTTASNSVGPTGTVSFYDTYNGSIVQLGGPGGAVTLTPNGPNQSIARFTTTGLLAGMHSIYAIYAGDANFSPATSSTLSLNLTDYNVIMNPQTLTLKAGQTGQVVMLIGSVGGFSGTVSFGCTPPAKRRDDLLLQSGNIAGRWRHDHDHHHHGSAGQTSPAARVAEVDGSWAPGRPWRRYCASRCLGAEGRCHCF